MHLTCSPKAKRTDENITAPPPRTSGGVLDNGRFPKISLSKLVTFPPLMKSIVPDYLRKNMNIISINIIPLNLIYHFDFFTLNQYKKYLNLPMILQLLQV